MARKRGESQICQEGLAEVDEQTSDAQGESPAEPHKPHRMDAPYAYYTDDGMLKAWGHNHVVTDHDEIQHLLERGARLSEVKS